MSANDDNDWAQRYTQTPSNRERSRLLKQISQTQRDALVQTWQAIDNALCERCKLRIDGRNYQTTQTGFVHTTCPPAVNGAPR